jgi:DNA repair exonuclease SbcCD ATPase subunit
MILFRNVKWKNILSTGNYWTEIKLDNNTNTLIVGENGAGKSTMLDALCFALFGKAFRAINKPQLINSINNKDAVVEVNFDTGNKSYKIIRGIKPNIFEIYCNGELVDQEAASRDYQEHLEKFILKLNYKSFTQIVILGSASFTPFMQLKPADRREIIEDLLDIQIFSTMNSLVRERLSNNKDLMANKKHEIELNNQKHDMQKKHIDELKQNNEEKVKEFETEIEYNLQVVTDMLANVATLTTETEELQLVVSSKIETESKVKQITKIESQIEINLSKYKKDIGFFQTHDDCPTCKQSIEESFKLEELKNLGDKITECQHGLSQLENKLLEEQSKLNTINNVQKQIQRKQVEIATNSATVTETNKYVAKLRKQVDELKTSKTVTDKEELELKAIINTLETLKQELKNFIDEKTYYEVAGNLLKDTGIKTKIVKQYLPIINKLVNKYLASLDFFVNFNLDESFKETIKSRHRDEFTYNNFSEGEKSKINLALLFTWRAIAKLKNSSNTNLLILDEIIDSALDHNAIDNFLSLINNTDDGTSVFVISPKGDIYNDKFHETIRFEKIKNFSKIKKT